MSNLQQSSKQPNHSKEDSIYGKAWKMNFNCNFNMDGID